VGEDGRGKGGVGELGRREGRGEEGKRVETQTPSPNDLLK